MDSAYRRIIHVDLDAFYVSAELLRHPDLRGKPVVVGGKPEQRGVACASSYEARAFGVRSGTPCRKAKELCPELIFLPTDFHYYSLLSRKVRKVFARYTDLIEPYSYDEAYLDISDYSRPGEAKAIAQRICREIYKRTGLSASAGVSYNKFIAKLASDYQKPQGLTVVSPARAKEFIAQHKVSDLYGIGRVRSRFLLQRGYQLARDLQALSLPQLLSLLGSYGQFLYLALQGIDERPVQSSADSSREPKSLGAERTFAVDLPLYRLPGSGWEEYCISARDFFARHNSLRQLPPTSAEYQNLVLWLYELCNKVSAMLQQHGLSAESVSVKMRNAEFQTYSRTVSWQGPENQCADLFPRALWAFNQLAEKLLQLQSTCKLRLLGVTGRGLCSTEQARNKTAPDLLLFSEI